VLEQVLQTIANLGVKLDILFNANCYGAGAVSVELAGEVAAVIDHLGGLGCCPEIVTTASPMIAHTVKTRFPGIEVRASVNMRIGTTQAMRYVQDLFDSFYLQRDLQRDLTTCGKSAPGATGMARNFVCSPTAAACALPGQDVPAT
jgi:predicted TIM-barrel fold metal-dependent hydrolase